MWLLLSWSLALAQETVQADALAPELRSLAQEHGQLIIMAAGFDAHDVVQEAVEEAGIDARITRVSADADPGRVMSRRVGDAGCGVFASYRGGGSVALTLQGVCGPEPEPEPVRRATAPAPEPTRRTTAPAAEPDAPHPTAPTTGATQGLTMPPPLAAAPSEALQWELLLTEATMPDPTTATLQGLLVGFGAGHFYAGDKRKGWIDLGVQGGGLLVSAVGAGLSASDPDAGPVVAALGVLAFSAGRVYEAVDTPYTVRKTRRAQVERARR